AREAHRILQIRTVPDVLRLMNASVRREVLPEILEVRGRKDPLASPPYEHDRLIERAELLGLERIVGVHRVEQRAHVRVLEFAPNAPREELPERAPLRHQPIDERERLG